MRTFKARGCGTVARMLGALVTSEELAPQDIDHQLAHGGWLLRTRNEMNLFAAPGVAVRELPTMTGGLSIEDADSLPESDVLFQEIAGDLQAVMELFAAIASELKD
jgi:hypothetical protein